MSATSESLLNAAVLRSQGRDLKSSGLPQWAGKQLNSQRLSPILSQVLRVCRFAGLIQRALSPNGVYFRFSCVSASLFVGPCLSVTAISLYLYLSVRPCLLVHLSLPVSVYLSLAASLSLSVHLSLFLRLFLSVQLSLSVRPFLLLYLCPPVCFGVSIDISPSFSVLLSLSHSVHLSLFFLGAPVPVCPSLSHCPFGAHVPVCPSAPLGAYVPVSFGAYVPVCLSL